MNTTELQEYIIDLRREFHQYPELSGQEHHTSARICEELESIGIPYEVTGGLNVIGRIKNGAGKTVAIRADFDALPAEELTDVPWKSRIPGCMHSCGHDAHAACLLGTARMLLDRRNEWSGTVFLCFQQGEEAGLGANECLSYLKEHGGVDAVLAIHVLPILPTGDVILQPGAVATGCTIFKINIKGKGGHGARPDLSVSAADIMCDIYQHIISIPSNGHEAARTCVVSPCKLSAGDRFNIIPEQASIEGSIRFLGRDDGPILMDKVRKTSESIAELHGGSAEVDYNVFCAYPVINDPAVTEAGRAAASRSGLRVVPWEPMTSSDNFADFLHEYPGYYCFVGCNSSRPGTTGVNHAPNFDLDENALIRIPDLFTETVIELNR